MAAVGAQRVVCPPDRHISANGLDILEVLEGKIKQCLQRLGEIFISDSSMELKIL